MAPRKQFLLRIDPALWRELERWAADDLRSVNAQVEWLLRGAVRARRSGSAATRPSHGQAPGAGGAAGGRLRATARRPARRAPRPTPTITEAASREPDRIGRPARCPRSAV